MGARAARSDERLTFYYNRKNTATTLRRATVRKAAHSLGMDKTAFLHLAAASLVRNLDQTNRSRRGSRGDPRLTDAQLAAIRSMEPQEVKPTHSFIALLGK